MATVQSVSEVTGPGTQYKSRLHNRRGQLVTASLGTALWNRARRRYDGPWMVPAAVARLDQLLTPDTTLLELGSGSSTAWYGQRCARVVSIEPDSKWAETTRRAIAGMSNVELRTVPLAEAEAEDEVFDVVIVDGSDTPDHTRTDSVRAVCERARVALVLDDSDRPRYAPCDEILAGWRMERFTGFKTKPLRPAETTVWTRR